MERWLDEIFSATSNLKQSYTIHRQSCAYIGVTRVESGSFSRVLRASTWQWIYHKHTRLWWCDDAEDSAAETGAVTSHQTSSACSQLHHDHYHRHHHHHCYHCGDELHYTGRLHSLWLRLWIVPRSSRSVYIDYRAVVRLICTTSSDHNVSNNINNNNNKSYNNNNGIR